MEHLSHFLTVFRSKLGVILALIGGVAAMIGGGVLLRARLKTDQIVQEKRRIEEYLQTAATLKTFWREGLLVNLDESLEGRCVEKTAGKRGAPGAYFRCNADYLNCLIEEKKGQLRNQNSQLIIQVLPQNIGPLKRYISIKTRSNSITPKSSHYSAHLILSTRERDELFHVFLEDECSEALLPTGLYSLGSKPTDGKEKLRWENKKRSIMVDKYLVTNRDIKEWKIFGGVDANKLWADFDVSELPKASTNLKPAQMEAYCGFKGKQVLSAPVLDSASFYPKENIKYQEQDLRGPYPWSRKMKKSYLYKAKSDENFHFDSEFCKKTFTEECLSIGSFYPHKTLAPSWMGIFHTLGGPLEYVKPAFKSDGNLKASSFYFDFRSPMHEIGKRLKWDGNGHNLKNIEDKVFATNDVEIKIGFRCMRYIYEGM